MEKSVSRRNSIICICLFVVIFGGLLALATVYDLDISKALVRLEPGQYYTTDPFGATFAAIGSWPSILFMMAAFAILYANMKLLTNKKLRLLGCIAANLVACAPAVYLVLDTAKYLGRHFGNDIVFNKTYTKIVFLFVFIACAEYMCWFFGKLDPKTLNALLKFAFVVIFAVALENLLINGCIKLIMCRPRYRTMWNNGDFSVYKHWYEKSAAPDASAPENKGVLVALQNAFSYIADPAKQSEKVSHVFKDAYKSFPSGHTGSAGAVYALLCLPKLLTKYNTKFWKTCLVLVSVLVTGIVAVSRIVCGAHFFSDVLCGGTIMFLCVALGMKIFIRSDFERA